MNWKDEGYLLSKKNYSENSIIIDVFTFDHGKYSGIVYGGTSRKKKNIFQIGNKILIDLNSKNENSIGYFKAELLDPVSPLFFDNKKKTTCIFSATQILKILLPDRQINKKIYKSFENLIKNFNSNDWINLYIDWELLLIKELGFESDIQNFDNRSIKEALIKNKNLLMQNFIIPNRLRMPIYRNILESYYN